MQAVWQFPLMTSVQQANYHPGLKRYIFANWAWISYDGYPRPDHTADEKNDRTGHQRTQLSLVEAPNPWGPFSIMHRDDDWSGLDLTGEEGGGATGGAGDRDKGSQSGDDSGVEEEERRELNKEPFLEVGH